MVAPKNATLTLRIETALKEALKTAADAEHRSIANMVEVLIRDYCKREGIPISDRPDPLQTGESAREQGHGNE
jgi:hypothetical protein